MKTVVSALLGITIVVVSVILIQVALDGVMPARKNVDAVPEKWKTNRPSRRIIPAKQFDTSWMNRDNTEPVLVVTWEFPQHWAGWGEEPNFAWAGYPIVRKPCPIDCTFSGDRARQPEADAVIFESQPFGRLSPAFPLVKPPGQKWVHFSYETNRYFPIQGDWPNYLSHMDWKMTYEGDSDVRVSMACNWGFDLQHYLAPPPPKVPGKFAVFVASNCQHAGGAQRLRYVKELMEYIDIDSYGICLHNVEEPFPTNTDTNRYSAKINAFSKYKFVLAFENSNMTDYVTEKLMHAYLSGSIPVYMGAPNIDEWSIGENSFIRTDEFASPRALATYLKKVAADEDLYNSYFSWKEKGMSPAFQQRLDECVFDVECRLCTRLALARDHVDMEVSPMADKRQLIGLLLALLFVLLFAFFSLQQGRAPAHFVTKNTAA